MKRIFANTLRNVFFVISFFVVLSDRAHAYIDPSAVNYVVQAVAAVVIAAGALLTVFRHKLVAFFKKDNGESQVKEIHMKEELEDSEE